MKYLALTIGGLFLCGCMSNQGLQTLASSEANVWNFSRISEGMTQAQVMRIMRKPYDYKTIEVCGEACLDIYDIWFYVIRPTVLGQSRLVHQNLTPVVFKNGILLGWGYHIYDKVAQSQRSALSNEEKKLKDKELEDKNIEKALEAPPGEAPQKNPTNAAQPGAPHPAKPNTQKQPAPVPPKKSQISPLSMSESSQNDENPPAQEPQASEKKEPLLNEEDERTMQQESEQDFDFW